MDKNKLEENDLPGTDKRAQDRTDKIDDEAAVIRDNEASAEKAVREIPSE